MLTTILSPGDPRAAKFKIVKSLTGVKMLPTDKNRSGFKQVRKKANKWEGWVNVAGKQFFLKPTQDDPELAAIQVYDYENPSPIAMSPEPGHSARCKSALPAHALFLPAIIVSLAMPFVPPQG